MNRSGLEQYKKVAAESDAAFASPHRLIQMLINGALDKISIAKGCMERGEIAKKGQNIGWAISIIDGLRVSLDKSAGGEISENLDALYDYMMRRLLLANTDNNIEILDEVSKLMNTVKSAWDEIGTQVNHKPASNGSDAPILTATVR